MTKIQKLKTQYENIWGHEIRLDENKITMDTYNSLMVIKDYHQKGADIATINGGEPNKERTQLVEIVDKLITEVVNVLHDKSVSSLEIVLDNLEVIDHVSSSIKERLDAFNLVKKHMNLIKKYDRYLFNKINDLINDNLTFEAIKKELE